MAKKLIYRNIFGRKVNLGGEGGNVSNVSSLPETGKAGEIYYNTTDGKYYVYTEEGFTEFGIQEGLPIIRQPESHKIDGVVQANEYDLEPNKYYVFGPIGGTPQSLVGSDGVELIGASSLTLHVETDHDIAKSYIGKFLANTDSPSITLVGAHFADDIPDLEASHTYEFNILNGICKITDITYTT